MSFLIEVMINRTTRTLYGFNIINTLLACNTFGSTIERSFRRTNSFGLRYCFNLKSKVGQSRIVLFNVVICSSDSICVWYHCHIQTYLLLEIIELFNCTSHTFWTIKKRSFIWTVSYWQFFFLDFILDLLKSDSTNFNVVFVCSENSNICNFFWYITSLVS